jgi:hypothetical protein
LRSEGVLQIMEVKILDPRPSKGCTESLLDVQETIASLIAENTQEDRA